MNKYLYIFILLIPLLHTQTNGTNTASSESPADGIDLFLDTFFLSELNAGLIKDYSYFSTRPKALRTMARITGGLDRKWLRLRVGFEGEVFYRKDAEDPALVQKPSTYLIGHPLENYLAFASDPIDVSLGYRIIDWGPGRRVRPTDNINPVDRRDLYDPQKLALFTMDLDWRINDKFSFSVVYNPYKGKDIYPISFTDEMEGDLDRMARLLDRSLAATNRTNIIPDRDIEEVEVPFKLNSSKGGFRLKYDNQRVASSFSFLYDYDKYYTSDLEMVIRERPDPFPYEIVVIEIDREVLFRLGADLEVRHSRGSWWLDACYLLTEDLFENWKLDEDANTHGERNPELQLIGGTEIAFGPDKRLNLETEYYLRYVFAYDDTTLSDYLPILADPAALTDLLRDKESMMKFFYRQLTHRLALQDERLLNRFGFTFSYQNKKKNLMGRLAMDYYLPLGYEKYVLSVTGHVYEHKRLGSLYVNPEIIFSPFPEFNIYLGLKAASAWQKRLDRGSTTYDERDYYGRYREHTRIYLKADYSWGTGSKQVP